ncbi:LysR family transcriptional regulator [Arenibaculum pallidiluteum]|uniref:LysR family transcriptional regulator n=1 Tax=Arenibaculum pallidiluteum TaxID=2812559 RepID=UPI001A95C6D8|nr:LysR family transcriptional regulator [Arenibaculum pallidiluteum]
MSLRALRSLVAIARHGTFARAADALGLTQSAVSLHVKALEEEFRAALFDRSRRRPVLTEAGRVALERAQAVLAAYDAIPAEIAAGQGLRGRLRLGAIQTALAGRLPQALGRLRRQHPHLRVAVASGMSAELALRVEAGDLDAAITTEPVKPHPAGLAFEPLYTDRFWIVAPPEAEGSDARTLLTTLPFLRFDKRAWAGRMIEDELRRQGVRIREEMELDSQEALTRMAASGLGVAVVPLADPDLDTLPPLFRLPFGSPQRERRVGLLTREDDPQTILTSVLATAMRAGE